MKKRLISGILLLLFCLTVCTSSYFIVNDLAENLNSRLEEALKEIENSNIPQAEKAVEDCEKKWDKYKTVFDIFLNHSMLEDLNVDLLSIGALLESGSRETAKEKIEDSISALKGVLDEQKISIGNIL